MLTQIRLICNLPIFTSKIREWNLKKKKLTSADTEEKCDVEGGNLMEKIVKAMECHEDLQCFSSYSLLGRTRQLWKRKEQFFGEIHLRIVSCLLLEWNRSTKIFTSKNHWFQPNDPGLMNNLHVKNHWIQLFRRSLNRSFDNNIWWRISTTPPTFMSNILVQKESHRTVKRLNSYLQEQRPEFLNMSWSWTKPRFQDCLLR